LGVQYWGGFPGVEIVKNANLSEPTSPLLAIDEELRQVLHSTPFQSSKQCQTLLKYLVEKSLRGQSDLLKERTIGMEVFGRSPDYNTADDPIVRARAGEVRKRLAQYYQSEEARGSTIQIVISSGSYRPTFVPHPGANGGAHGVPIEELANSVPPHAAEEHLEHGAAFSGRGAAPSPSKTIRLRALGIAAGAACAVLLVAWIALAYWNADKINLFWKPFLDSKKTIVIYMGTAELYVPDSASTEKALSLLPPAELQQPMTEWPLPPLDKGRALTSNDILVDRTNFVGVGDVAAVVKVSEFLTGHGRILDLRSGPNLPFEDLRGSPVILTGAGSNYWTLDITRDLPFFVDRGLRIRERGGQGRVWSTPLWQDRTIREDYAIISRLLDSKTGAPVVILAGITMCGNQAAGEFLTDPVQLRKLGSVPRDAFEHKNIEIVLHTTLANCTPTSMDIAALRYW
jgi:hypothetical protein